MERPERRLFVLLRPAPPRQRRGSDRPHHHRRHRRHHRDRLRRERASVLCREKRVSPILFDDDKRLEVSTTSLGLSHTRRTTSQTMFNISQSWQQFGIPSFDPQKCHLPCQFTRASVDLFFSAFPETLSQQCLNPAPRCGRGAPS